MIIGTAGHIDHGKTALVKALTGIETDRLKEEKLRGITIDLGFAYVPLDTGEVLGFVDVPGHERFVHTMLAGASGIDFALLVVAADDGPMPQTFEHLAIVDLLGVRRGAVALSKADIVSPERLAAAERETRAAIAGSFLEAAEIVPVSASTGHGIGELRRQLIRAAADPVARPASGRFRLAVDRSFTLAGAGVVVTGTVLSGIVHVGDQVLISPAGLPARVRSLHVHNRAAESGAAGNRCALNLAGRGVGKEAIRRGDVVLDPELHAPAARIDASLRILPGEPKPIGQWFPVRLHHAAAEAGARVVLLGDASLPPGTEAEVQLVLDRPIAASATDRFVIRDVSAQRTIGGGAFIDLRAPARKRRTPERRLLRRAMANEDPVASFAALLDVSPFAQDLTVFARDRALSSARTDVLAGQLQLVLLGAGASQTAMLPDRWRSFAADLRDRLGGYHREHPDLQGMGRDKLRLSLQARLPPAAFAAALLRLASNGEVALDGAFVRLASHEARLSPNDELLWRAVSPLLGRNERFRPPRVRDIAGMLHRPEADIRHLLKLAGRMGWVDEVAQDHFFLRTALRECVALISDIGHKSARGEFTAAQFRDRVNSGRKVAIQILDFFDRHGVTIRRGDLRRLNSNSLVTF